MRKYKENRKKELVCKVLKNIVAAKVRTRDILDTHALPLPLSHPAFDVSIMETIRYKGKRSLDTKQKHAPRTPSSSFEYSNL